MDQESGPSDHRGGQGRSAGLYKGSYQGRCNPKESELRQGRSHIRGHPEQGALGQCV